VTITKRLFSAEFRVEAAHRVIDSGRTIAEVARELAVGEQLLGRWVRDERIREAAALAVPDVPDTPVTESERAELVRLRRKVIDQARQFEEQERDCAPHRPHMVRTEQICYSTGDSGVQGRKEAKHGCGQRLWRASTVTMRTGRAWTLGRRSRGGPGLVCCGC
jgi:transposase